MFRFFLATVGSVLAAATAVSRAELPTSVIDGDSYTATPAGWVLSHCVYTDAKDMKKKCFPKVNSANPVLRASSDFSKRAPSSPRASVHRDRRQLPADYNGWLQYTAINTTDSFETFTGLMSVPDLPKEEPQILYLFPGLQNIDWIPKVDKEPTLDNPFDIIQPVLQFPGETRNDWGVRSWYVTVHAGALMSELVSVQPGDAILCNMTHLGGVKWFIGSTVQSTGKQTNQLVDSSDRGASERLAKQPWAYNTVECYGCRGCGTYPTQPVKFTNLVLTTVGGGKVTPDWRVNPKPAQDLQCKEHTVVNGPDSVTISFTD
eukprot:m.1241462 g.1241462  ORF g.1241462 m.1241462 type:complete len:318 (+) comp24679_c1_seq1:94-1047(+)